MIYKINNKSHYAHMWYFTLFTSFVNKDIFLKNNNTTLLNSDQLLFIITHFCICLCACVIFKNQKAVLIKLIKITEFVLFKFLFLRLEF